MIMAKRTILVLGVGNLLLSDEGVGIHVVRQLQNMSLDPDVEVVDGGTGAFELIEHFRGRRKVIIVDAVKGDAKPGTLLRFTPEEAALQWHPPFTAHQFSLRELLYFAQELTPRLEVILFGVVPEDTKFFSMQLSRSVKSRIPKIISSLLDEINRTVKLPEAIP
jgi:hydrogenase maturation protease